MTNNSADKSVKQQVTIYIDDVPYQVSPDNNLLAGVLSNKLNLPYFCWHPSMGSVGACRQCAVTQYQDENDTRGRMIMSCMTPVVEGMRIGLTDEASAKFREQVIAAMMTNHPHDCPVCAEGGECHLQDMTVMTGHSTRKYQGEKRTFTNQYLGDLVGHEMNRCITCYRCVRFYKDYAGGKDFDVYGSRNEVYFGRQTDGALESEFSGNLVEVCPTGVFTNKLFSGHYSRKWDLQSSPSICSHCSVGCNTSIGERYGSVRRVMNRYNPDINGYFLCDRGRFGIGFVNSTTRITKTTGIETNVDEPQKGVFNELSLAKSMAHHRHEKFIGIGSARASFEANRLLKYLVGRPSFSLGYTNNEMQLAVQHKKLLAHYPQQSLAGVEQHDLVLVIGENIQSTAPRLALSLRQTLRVAAIEKADSIGVNHWQDSAVRTYAGNSVTPLFSLQAQKTDFDDNAKAALVISPKDIIEYIVQLTNSLGNKVPSAPNKSEESNIEKNDVKENKAKFIAAFIQALAQSKKPLIITGLSLNTPKLLAAVDDLMACLMGESISANPELVVVAPQCNSVGNLFFLNEQTLSIEQVIEHLKSTENASLLLLEQDLAQLSDEQVNQLRAHCKTLMVLDHSNSALSSRADIVLPVAAVSESAGHFVNYQANLQPFYAAHHPQRPIMENWQWLSLLAKTLFERPELNFNSLYDMQRYFARHGEPWALQVLQSQRGNQQTPGTARQTHRASGRTAMMANQSVHEPKTLIATQDYLNFSMEGARAGTVNDMPFTWSPGWNSNQAVIQHQKQVNSELNHQAPENKLTFCLSEHFDEQAAQLWQTEKTQTNENELIFIQNSPWFLADQTARVLPEFILMFKGNCIEVSATLAEKNSWQYQEILMFSVNGQQVMAEVRINDNLLNNVMLGSIFEIPSSVNNCLLSLDKITKATTKDIAKFHQQNLLRHEQANTEKKNVLASLKQQDQTIPISIMAKAPQAKALNNDNSAAGGKS